MHHLNAVAAVFETSRGSLKLLLDNGQAGSCLQGPTLDDAGHKSSCGKLEISLAGIADPALHHSGVAALMLDSQRVIHLCGCASSRATSWEKSSPTP